METYIDTDVYEFDFGKFSGFTYEFVLNQDPFYLKWVIENFDDFLLDDAATEKLHQACVQRTK